MDQALAMTYAEIKAGSTVRITVGAKELATVIAKEYVAGRPVIYCDGQSSMRRRLCAPSVLDAVAA